MRCRFALALLVPLVAMFLVNPALAAKVTVDYDHEFDFSKIVTYAWHESADAEHEQDPLMHQRILNAIDYHLSMDGARKVDSDPDVWVTYHSDSKEEVNINSTSMGYGYGAGWYGYGTGGMGTTSTTVSTYERGTLIIDVWDAKTKNMIWRGTATAVVKEKPEKVEKQINKALAKLFSKWEQMVQKGL